MTKANRMNDLFEGAVCDQEGIDAGDRIQDFQNHIYLKCFSESCNNIIMWSMYGDDSKGICVKYDFSSLDCDSILLKMLYPIYYTKDRYISCNISNLKNNIYLFLRKSDNWKHEKEWRLIYKADYSYGDPLNKEVKKDLGGVLLEPNTCDYSSAIPIKTGCVTSIYFGNRVSEDSINSVKKCLGNGLKYYQMFTDKKTYGLRAKRISEK